MIRRLLRHIAHELGHLDVASQLALEAAEKDLSLARLETIHHGGNGTCHVGFGKEHQLLVHEVLVAHLLLRVVHQASFLVSVDPCLSVICSPLIEGEIDGSVVFNTIIPVSHLVRLKGAKVLLRLLRCARAKTFVVFDLEALSVLGLLLPSLVLRKRVEAGLAAAFPCFDDRREELLEEARQPREGGPPGMDQVDQEPFDVRTVAVLVGHDHDRTVPEPLQLGIVLPVQIEANDLDQVLYLLVGHHLLERGITHVENLAAEWEDAPLVSADDAEPGHS
mmetsp:Transcript_14025/g.33357  ORF Transcript_14025/g.33357 Transcript_14025/m.33357 type:complete len:278 (+) Transcript_14025:1633-2466(+)